MPGIMLRYGAGCSDGDEMPGLAPARLYDILFLILPAGFCATMPGR